MFIVSICLIFLASLVASQGLSRAPNRALLISIFFLGAWVIMVYGLQLVFDTQIEYRYQITYSRAVFAVGALSLISLIWLVSSLLSMEKQTREMIEKALLLIGAGISLLCMSPYVIADVAIQGSSSLPLPQYGPLILLYGISVVATLAVILYMVVWGSAKEKEQNRRQQVRIVGFTIALAVAVAAVTNLIVPWLTGDAGSSLLVAISVLIVLTGLSYAIIRHGLFNIKLAAVRTIGYTLTVSLLAVIYMGLAYVVSFVFFRSGSGERTFGELNVDIVNIALAFLLAFLFQPVKRFFDKFTDGIFYRNQYDSEAFYGRLSEILTAESTNLKGFLTRITSEIETTFKAERVFLHVQWGPYHAVAGTSGHAELSDTNLEEIRLYTLQHDGNSIVTDTLHEVDPLHRLLARHGVAIAVPLMQKNAMLGCLFLGNRRSGEYTKRDITVLETVSNELVIAVQNALSMQEIKEFNKTLQQRIEAATGELRASNEKLMRLDAAKDEFVSMASHQLRTPLTSVKGYISMVLEGDAGKITPMQKQLLEEAFVSSERMVHLIGDFLNVSRLQTGKFVVERRLVNLADIVEEEVSGLKATAEARTIKLRFRKPSRFPMLYLDDGKLRQVMMNFIDNAIFYSTDHSVAVVKLRVEGGDAVFEVIDTGIGVPASEQEHLFTKFFRAENARRQRPDGTGIGLFLAKKVITAHGGSMIFTSVEGEGSTFGFRLPIKKLSEKPSETAGSPDKTA